MTIIKKCTCLYILIALFFLLFSRSLLAEEEPWQRATVVRCESWVSLRVAPDTSSERLARIPLGAVVEARAYNAEFCLCRFQEKEGFVLREYLSFATDTDVPSSDAEYVVPHVSEYLTLRSNPGDNAKELAKIRPGERMKVLGWDGVYCMVEVKGLTGWVHSGYIMAENMSQERWPYDYAALTEDLEQIRSLPACQLDVIGVSADGRDIPVILYGSSTAKHHVLIQAGIHAREIMTGRLAVDLLLSLAEKYPTGIDDVCLHIIPVSNPDGLEIAIHGPSAIRDAALRANIEKALKKEHIDTSDWKSNARCVDLNRNFDCGWDRLKGREPGSQRYRGETPHSEPESKALVNWVEQHDFDATVSIHSKGSLLYWLGATGDLSETNRSFTAAISSATGYPMVTSESDVEKGGFKDWALEEKGIPSVTIETGCREPQGTPQEYSGILLRCKGLYERIAQWVKEQGAEGR